MPYQTPSAPIAALVNLKPDPLMLFGSDRRSILMADRPSYPSIEELREPKIKLAGRQINPDAFMPYGQRGYFQPRVRDIVTGEDRPLRGIPADGQFRYFSWSPRGSRLAFCLLTETGLQLWTCPRGTLACTPVGEADINNSLGGSPYDFVGEDRVIVRRRLAGTERPELAHGGTEPFIQETTGQEGSNRTYTNLLRNQADVDQFRYFASGQLWRHDLTGGEGEKWGRPGIIAGIGSSPDRNYFLITYVTEPFSFTVPYDKFADRVELLDADGKHLRTLEERPALEHLPPAFGSVITQRRRYTWRSDHPAQLYWTEAQDGGDPRTEAEVRDQLFYLEPPFTGEPTPSVKLPLRFGAVRWLSDDFALVIDWSWRERRQVTRRWWPAQPERAPEVIYDHNWEDNYNDPGNFVGRTLPNEHTVLLRYTGGGAAAGAGDLGTGQGPVREQGDQTNRPASRPEKITEDYYPPNALAPGTKLLLSGSGHSAEGSRPFLDTYDVDTGTTERIWQSAPPYYERPLFFLDDHPGWFVLAREQLQERPNYFLRHLGSGEETQLTDFDHPYPQLRDANYEKVKYEREDGVQLSGDLHTPRGFTPGEDAPLPTLLWAYPQEFKDAEKAGQVTSSPHQFTRISPLAPLPFLAAGMAVFDDFAMPIVGEGDEEPNETFIEQVRMNARAAVDKLVGAGVADPARIYVGGHSYGAFMTAHLLAHTDLFAGGIARSGAYNRTLTPFGFQAEERNFWEVPETYVKLSPFVHADKIDAPLLLIHGEEDSNSGTYPIQSRRMFAALNSLGKTARLVMLPYEDHSYAAEESILHMLWEMEEWMKGA